MSETQEFLRHLCDVVAQHERGPNHFLSTVVRDRLIQQARDTFGSPEAAIASVKV